MLRHRFHPIRVAASGLLLGVVLLVMNVVAVLADSTGPPFPR